VPADVASEVEQKMEVAAQALLQTFLDRATLAKVNFSLSLSLLLLLHLSVPMRDDHRGAVFKLMS
jgi:hypothetical protein